jgi:hypothetical protein
MIENNILAISNKMFKDKKDWVKVTDSQKEQFFFIFNRYFSKKHSDKSFLLNDKSVNKTVGMDLWYEYFKNKPYPQWFWSKSPKKQNDEDLTDKDFNNLREHLDVGEQELNFLLKHHHDEIIEELQYLKKLTK